MSHLNCHHFYVANVLCFSKATLHMELNELKEAKEIYRDLLKRNPENWSYYKKVEECLKLGLFCLFFFYPCLTFVCGRVFPLMHFVDKLSLNDQFSNFNLILTFTIDIFLDVTTFSR